MTKFESSGSPIWKKATISTARIKFYIVLALTIVIIILLTIVND